MPSNSSPPEASTPDSTGPTQTTVDPATTAPPTTPAPAVAVDIDGLRFEPIDAAGVPQATAAVATETIVGESPATLADDYVEVEFVVSGTAQTFTGPASGPVTEADSIAFTTRMLMRTPADPAQFSGRVVLEPFNTSAGSDLDAIWRQTHRLLQEQGDAWIGVTGRTSSADGLRQLDAARYGSLSVPVNDVQWDVLRQIASALKQGGSASPVDLTVEHVYMVGFSQSGIDVSTFATAFNGRARMSDGSSVYDGYLLGGHAGFVAPVQSGASAVPSFESIPIGPVDVPVIDLETQTDVAGFRADLGGGSFYTSIGHAAVRRGDSDADGDRYRLYEVAGAPHAAGIPGCEGTPSEFPTGAFIRAAIVRLQQWAEDGVAPPEAARLELTEQGEASVVGLDEFGNALGGVRSPQLDVPLFRYDANSTPGVFCKLSGIQTPLDVDGLRTRHGSADGYLDAFVAALDQSIAEGWLLELDRDLLLDQQTISAQAAFGG